MYCYKQNTSAHSLEETSLSIESDDLVKLRVENNSKAVLNKIRSKQSCVVIINHNHNSILSRSKNNKTNLKNSFWLIKETIIYTKANFQQNSHRNHSRLKIKLLDFKLFNVDFFKIHKNKIVNNCIFRVKNTITFPQDAQKLSTLFATSSRNNHIKYLDSAKLILINESNDIYFSKCQFNNIIHNNDNRKNIHKTSNLISIVSKAIIPETCVYSMNDG